MATCESLAITIGTSSGIYQMTYQVREADFFLKNAKDCAPTPEEGAPAQL